MWVFFFVKKKWKRILAARDHNYRFIKGQIDRHRETYDMNNVRDFIDTYIAVTSGQKEGKEFDGMITMDIWALDDLY